MAKKSFFQGLFDARQQQANRYVNGFLLTMDDATLEKMGIDRKKIKKEATQPFPY